MKNMNVPNQLTIIRIVLTPVFLALFLSDIPHHYLIGLIVFAIGSFTDFLDGKIARKKVSSPCSVNLRILLRIKF